MAEPELRRAVREDAPVLRRIAEAAYALYVPRIGRRPAPMDADFSTQVARGRVWIAEVDGEPAGYLVGYPRDADWFVENLAVDPTYQDRGVGRRLMVMAEAQARRCGLPRVALYTNRRMWESAGFYGRLGFYVTHAAEEAGFQRIYMAKDLETAEAGRQ